ncbi:nucleotide sugar dehydrogenase [Priestia megaterium]|uniref:UDP-N-acetyl-D-mannosamine dehydrogenase n=1 Tax=Priestia megaterium (strain ATCC 14581 / DSM 32 / CCUG 1817 / JCM 2506 / NBRC 15308 / NCIMB 9376 / NCTC 10342 / NRRL B-14308 / VKM B-512 / Ford 19) TaxID=1348623 RepID=A0A0B6ASU1_PRIM2|nr:nucleotide sugar dehydrogenase [Priestia megaterium]AJI23773.1 UDP-N-acetyl-D-mannosamine dehydrogenase [Priestia megaterium NBRC 15308 = ATCC 14581]KFN06878.1 UDP-N-acetyl-D-mannosamine dehydrogenase [Priestia megaterium]KGJ85421.1 UDP-N-acetyl-D-mannosamine dehydrogenase [Priestia megaterium NBRC 15308 = ATCC 14581]MDR4233605.1 nucleotide sugar dehydrogenase [Priestia megaterium]MED3806892.1 nucleotide sugar dehydrogenase [Priestia megaterium]
MTKKLCVVGLGYIGLPTAVMFANHGLYVHGVDVNQKAVELIKNKQLHIEENGLQERLESAVDNGHFTVGTTAEEADIFIIAVPSPINEDKTANLNYVREATKSIVPYVRKGNLVILESTVPPRTVEDVMLPVLKETGLELGSELFVSHSPERVIPGKVFEELVNNDRIVGGINEESSRLTVELYKTFVKGNIHVTDATTAEMVKVIENTYRDVNIAFANELAKISEKIGVNAWEAIKLANYHPRVNIHLPGPGVGGHCIAVDPWFLTELQPELAKIISLSRHTNDSMPEYTALKTKSLLDEKGIQHGRVAVLGLAFKGNIDDMRESPSTDVLHHLEKLGVDYTAFDPHIKENKIERQTQSLDEAVAHADVILILTDHNEFKELLPSAVENHMRTKVIFDTKNCIQRDQWKGAGFDVVLLGDSKVSTL